MKFTQQDNYYINLIPETEKENEWIAHCGPAKFPKGCEKWVEESLKFFDPEKAPDMSKPVKVIDNFDAEFIDMARILGSFNTVEEAQSAIDNRYHMWHHPDELLAGHRARILDERNYLIPAPGWPNAFTVRYVYTY